MVYAESEVLYRVIGICREFTEESYMPVLRVAKQMRNTLSSMLIMVMVAACGGSGPAGVDTGTGGTGGTGGTDTSTSPSLSLAWKSGYSQEGNLILDTAPRTLEITLLDGAGSPIANEIVEAAASLGALFPSSGNVATNSSGVATLQIDVTGAEEGEAGAITVVYTAADGTSATARQTYSATISAVNAAAGLQLDGRIYPMSVLDAQGSVASVTEFIGSLTEFDAARSDESEYSINAVQTGLFVVRVLNANDVPLDGAIVTVTSTAGALTPASGQVLTNSNGVAYVTIASGGSDPGAAGTITATIAEDAVSKTFSVGAVNLSLGFSAASKGVIGVNSATDGSVTLSPAGTASLSVSVFDDEDNLFTTPLTINFTSSCASSGDARIDTGVQTINGRATATYEATGCATTDSLQASVVELADVTAMGSLSVEDAPANSIRFVSATPTSIAMAGTGGNNRQEFATLIYEVIDRAGKPKAGEPVSVSLSTVTGGINLTGDLNADGKLLENASITTADERLTSNAEGRVSVIVNAGTVATSVRAVATITVNGLDISSVSDSLIVSTGLADQNSMSLSATILTPAGYEFDGFSSTLNIRAADAFNNPVPDGTAVNFTTEYGRIVDTCTTSGGTCSVAWNSQNPRRPDNTNNTGPVPTLDSRQCDSNMDGTPDTLSNGWLTGEVVAGAVAVPFGVPCPVLTGNVVVGELTGSNFTSVIADSATSPTYPGQVFGGRSTVLAYAIGEESFVDANGNGQYDTGEAFVDMPEAYIDHNEDGVFGNMNTVGACMSRDAVKTVSGTEADAGRCDTWQTGGEEEEFIDFNNNGVYDVADGVYNGTLCPDDAAASVCTRDLITVSDSLTLNVGGSSPYIGIYSTSNILLAGPDVGVDITDTDNSNARRIYISDLFNGRLPGGTTVSVTSDNCDVLGVSSYEFVDTSAFGNHAFDIFLGEDTSTDKTSGLVTVTVAVPERAGNVVATRSFSCTDAD
jgi:hypothetical protein